MAFSVSSTVPRTISPRWSRIRASSIWMTWPIGFSSLIGCSFLILEEAVNPESAKDSVRYHRMFGDAGEHVGEPCLWINVVHLGRDDQAVHDRGALAAAIGTAEQPRLSTQGYTAHAALGGVVGQADAAVVEEAREH